MAIPFGGAFGVLNGLVTWIKPSLVNSRANPGGFTVQASAYGSHYHQPERGERILSIDRGQLALTGGNLDQDVINQIRLGSDNRVTNLSNNKLSLTFSLSTGFYRGRVVNPANAKTIPFSGVVLQDYDFGSGFFLGISQSGRVLLRPDSN